MSPSRVMSGSVRWTRDGSPGSGFPAGAPLERLTYRIFHRGMINQHRWSIYIRLHIRLCMRRRRRASAHWQTPTHRDLCVGPAHRQKKPPSRGKVSCRASRPTRGLAGPLSPGQRSTTKQGGLDTSRTAIINLLRYIPLGSADAYGRPPPLNRSGSTCERIPLRKNYPQASGGAVRIPRPWNHLGSRVIHRKMSLGCG